MKKPETKFRARFVTELKKLEKFYHFSIQQTSLRGTPDILACVNGSFVAMELKATFKSPISRLQSYHLKKIQDAEGIALVVSPDNMDDTLDMLRLLAKEKTYA
jgi:hypothetical protein